MSPVALPGDVPSREPVFGIGAVSLTALSDPTGMAKLVSFQFAGESGARGVPSVR